MAMQINSMITTLGCMSGVEAPSLFDSNECFEAAQSWQVPLAHPEERP